MQPRIAFPLLRVSAIVGARSEGRLYVNRYDKVMARIAKGERILIDGATGTEIERRGVPQLDGAWNGGGALSHPDTLRQVHKDYIRQGAEIVISNTFATHRQALRIAGEEENFDAYNRRGVELAIEARDETNAPHVLVAGGISYWAWTGPWVDPQELSASAGEQAAIMADAGADLLMLEMMVDIERMLATLKAAQETGLPVWVGLSCKPNEAGTMCLYQGDTLADALDALAGKNVPLVNIMHTEVDYIDACLDIVADHWSGPVGVYAHSARWVNNVCYYDQTVSPSEYAQSAGGWLSRDVRVIGACCGLGVDHIAALKQIV